MVKIKNIDFVPKIRPNFIISTKNYEFSGIWVEKHQNTDLLILMVS